jgi:hypothetical protein
MFELLAATCIFHVVCSRDNHYFPLGVRGAARERELKATASQWRLLRWRPAVRHCALFGALAAVEARAERVERCFPLVGIEAHMSL